MKKEVLKKFLIRFSKSKLPDEILENILEASDDILNMLAELENNLFGDAIIIVNALLDNNIPSLEIKACLSIYLDALEHQKKYFYNLLTDNFTSKNGLIMTSLNILKNCDNENTLKSAYKAITNPLLYKLGINLKLAQIISEVKLKDSLDYIEKLYLDKEEIDVPNLLESAKIIADSPRSFNAHYAYFILNRKSIIEASKQYEAARLINLAKKDYNARYADIVLKRFIPQDNEYAFKGAKIVLLAKEVYQAHFAEELLLNEKISNNNERLISAFLICQTKNDIETSFIYKLYITDYFLNNNLAPVLSSLIVNQDTEKNSLLLKELVDSPEKLNSLKENIEKILIPLEISMPKEYEEGLNIFNNILQMNLGITLDIKDITNDKIIIDFIMEIDNTPGNEVDVKDIKRRVLKKEEEL